jgi:hypothetical protein
MPQAPLKHVEAHWHKLIENFQTTSLGFYSAVEEALEARKIPGLKTSRVDWHEGGILSQRREYLRVTGERHTFDVCAAPFGTGFFFSSWLTPTPSSAVFAYTVAFTALTWLVSRVVYMGLRRYNLYWLFEYFHLTWLFYHNWTATVVVLIPSVLVVMWAVAVAARRGVFAPERAMAALPIVGWIYRRMFLPETYYSTDTMLMFQSAVHSAMLEVINGLLAAKGLRALNDSEVKPVEKQLVDKRHAVPEEVLTAAATAN